MIQEPIRDYNGEPYSVEEGAALVEELNARTKHDVDGYNNIASLGVKLKYVNENYGNRIENLEANQITGVVQYPTLADLPVSGEVNVSYKVTNDPTASNNGFYSWNGSEYIPEVGLYNGEIEEGETEAVSGDKVFKHYKPNTPWFSPSSDLSTYPKGAILGIFKTSNNTYTDNFKLKVLKNRTGSNGVIIQIFDITGNNIIGQYVINPNNNLKTGIEEIIITEYNDSGLEIIMLVNWDTFSDESIIGLNIDILNKSIDEKIDIATEFTNYQNAVLSQVRKFNYLEKTQTFLDIDSIYDSSFPYEAIIDLKVEPTSNGVFLNERTFFLSYFRNKSDTGYLFQVKELIEGSYTIVAQLYNSSSGVNFSGKQTIEIPQYSNSGIKVYLTADFDLVPETYQVSYTNQFKLSTAYFDDLLKLQSFDSSSLPIEKKFVAINPFGDILPKAFKSKLYEMADDIEIVLLGDSLIGLIGSATQRVDAANLPPACNYNHLTYRFWESICKNKVVADRWDSIINPLTESGTFSDADVTKFNTPNWSGEYSEHTSICRESNTANASVAFDWDLDAYEKLNFIGRKSTDGAATVTFTVVEGNGKIEILDKSSGTWSEANGATISQYIDDTVATDGSGYSHHVRNWRTKFRRATGATGSITVTASKDESTSEYLYYWGTERWNGLTIHVTNAGRGGRSVFNLQKNFINDVVERKPDLVIQSLSLANEFGKSLSQIKSDYENFLIFDSGGISIKQQSNDFTDFQALLIVPHGFREYWNGNQAIEFEGSQWQTDNQIAYYNYQRVKNYIKNFEEANLPIIDIGSCLLDEAKNLGLTYEEAFTTSSSTSTNSFTKDDIHTNDYGIRFWNKYLYGLFKI